ncbi:MAG: hypothetical protein AAF517_23455 [Planctomycetota bacterium]
MKFIVGVFVGLVIGAALKGLLGHWVDLLYSIPETIDPFSNKSFERMRLMAWRALRPPGAFALSSLANALGCVAAAGFAMACTGRRSLAPAITQSVFFAFAGIGELKDSMTEGWLRFVDIPIYCVAPWFTGVWLRVKPEGGKEPELTVAERRWLSVLGVLVGSLAGAFLMMASLMVCFAVYPPPESFGGGEASRMKEWYQSLPPAAFIQLVLSQGLSCMGGAAVAMLIARRRSILPAIAIGILFSISALRPSPDFPAWYAYVEAPVVLIFAWTSGYFLRRDPGSPDDDVVDEEGEETTDSNDPISSGS